MQNTRILYGCALVVLLGFCLPCCADTVSRVDIRTEPPGPTDYFVVICARESEPWGTGHTFVVWVQQDKVTGRVHSQGFGFYPEIEKVIVRLFTGDGIVHDESTKSSSVKPWLLTHRLIVHVDQSQFEAGLRAKNEWVGSGIDYHLFENNCTHFAHDMMRAIQLGAPAPAFGERPATYLTRLMALDLGRNRTRLERLPATFVTGQR